MPVITKLTEDIIVERINTGSSWVPKYNGIRLTHVPTRTVVECFDHDSSHKNHVEALKTLRELSIDVDEEHVLIPTKELKKLEEARLKLYDFLEVNIDMRDTFIITEVMEITKQIWQVANRRDWNES